MGKFTTLAITSALAAILVFSFVSPAIAGINKRLLGIWEHVDEEYKAAEKSTMIFKTNGQVVLQDYLGNSDWPDVLTWETDGKILRFFEVKSPGKKDEEFAFTYRIEGNHLFLRPYGEDDKGKEMTLVRVKAKRKS